MNQLHADCGQRIRYEKHCPKHGKVDGAAIVSGYEYAAGQYVVIDEDEIERLRPARDKAVSVQQFVHADEVDARLFSGRSLYLVPDGLAARRPYSLLNQAMVQRARWALGRVVLHGSRLLVLVRPTATLLVMHVLHFPEEVRAHPPQAAGPQEIAVTDEEHRLAGLLVDAASTPLDWSCYRDESAAELQTLIEAKVAGRPLPAPADEPVAVLPLLEALKQSVAAVPSQPPAPKSRRRPSKGGVHRDESSVSTHAGNARRAL